MKRVGFWFRVLATLIDGVLCLVLGVGLMMVLRPAPVVMSFLLWGGWLAWSSLEVTASGTVGKILLRLRIGRADGSAADYGTLLLRWSTKQLPVILGLLYLLTDYVPLSFLSSFTALLVVIGCLFASTDNRQAWHDRWAKTAVFRRPRRVLQESAFPVLPPRQG